MKKFTLLALSCIAFLTGKAQNENLTWVYTEVTPDAVPVEVVPVDTIYDAHRVVTNTFRNNWFIFAEAGAHTYRGAHSSLGSFGGTISPEFGIGIGKWVTPGIGLKLQYMLSNNRGYTLPGQIYAAGGPFYTANGEEYYKLRSHWWEISGSVLFNLSRLFDGYMGDNNRYQMNQVYLNLGFGWAHFYKRYSMRDNRIGARAEVQYSRFFTPAKLVSLDIKFRTEFYETNHLEQHSFDLAFDLGVTYYLGGTKHQGWQRHAAVLVQP